VSGLLGITLPGAPAFIGISAGANWSDEIQPTDYRRSRAGSIVADQDREADVLWPRSSFPGQNTPNGVQNGILDAAHQYWEWTQPPSGVSVRKKVSGVTRNTAGTPIGGVTVWLFNTATGLLVDTQVSDSSGNFTCGDPNAVNCFAVGYLMGSPDTSGVTVDTLSGT